jgi:hypothetical protein
LIHLFNPAGNCFRAELDQFTETKSFLGLGSEVVKHPPTSIAQGLDGKFSAGSGKIKRRLGRAEAQFPWPTGTGQVLFGLEQAAVLGSAIVAQLGEKVHRIGHCDLFDDGYDLAWPGTLYYLPVVFHILNLLLLFSIRKPNKIQIKKAACRHPTGCAFGKTVKLFTAGYRTPVGYHPTGHHHVQVLLRFFCLIIVT